jgi:hypothetical protein
MNTAARIFLILNAVAFILIGIKTMLDPVAGMAALDLSPRTVTASNEIRSIYGGMHFSFGCMMLAGALISSLTRHALWFCAAFLGGLVAGRVSSLLLDGQPNTLANQLLVFESLVFIAAAFLQHGIRLRPAAGNA